MLEESFEQLNQKQCAAYLKKLKLPQEECTLEFLDRLIRRHLEEIPFENLWEIVFQEKQKYYHIEDKSAI